MTKIDLRPHYAFAYSVESMTFGSKSLLYYSRKEKALHYKYKAPIIDFLNDGRKDMEFSVSISDDDAKVLEKLFALMVDVFNAYKGEPWHVLDGYECVSFAASVVSVLMDHILNLLLRFSTRLPITC